MFKNNKKQFINVLKQDKQLKVDYKIIQDNKILKQEQSTFMLQTTDMAHDALFKLNSLQKDIPYSYISSLYTSSNQQILENLKIDTRTFEAISLNKTHCIAIPKNDILQYSNYFKNSGIDFLVSPFTILAEQLQYNGQANSFNILVHDNKLFIIILDINKQISYGTIKELTPFDNVQDTNFYNDEVIGQKLYDEVHFLEIQQALNDITEEYYKTHENVDFLTSANILYTIKQLSDDQLDSLHETVMLAINYQSINVDEYLHSIAQKLDAPKYSFVAPRVKKTNYSVIIWLVLLIVSIFTVSGVLYYKISTEDEKVTQVQKNIVGQTTSKSNYQNETLKPEKIEEVKEKIIKLPNHTLKNTIIVDQTLVLFDMIPYDAILKELEINKTGSTFVCNFISSSTSANDMKEKLLQIYNESKVILKHENKAILSTIIANKDLKPMVKKQNEKQSLEYKKHKFMPISKVSKYIESLLNIESKVTYKSKQKAEFLTYNFTVNTMIKTPKEFFDFIESLNTKDIPLNINYPIEFGKVDNAINVKFNLQFHQLNKKPVKPKM